VGGGAQYNLLANGGRGSHAATIQFVGLNNFPVLDWIHHKALALLIKQVDFSISKQWRCGECSPKAFLFHGVAVLGIKLRKNASLVNCKKPDL